MENKTRLSRSSFLCLPFLLIALICGVYTALGQGILVLQHSGSTDPTTEGFSLAYIGSQARVGPVVGDLGVNSWMTAVSHVNNNVVYRYTLSSEQAAAMRGGDWVMSLGVRVVASDGTFGNNYAMIYTGSGTFVLHLGSQADGDPTVLVGGTSLGPSYVLEGGGPGYHDYELRYSALTGAADLWIDGRERLAGLLPDPASVTPSALVDWGQGQGGPSHANWSTVSLAIVPEPSPITLWGVGLVALSAMSCRRRERSAPDSLTEQDHWSGCGRATSPGNAAALGRPHRSVPAFGVTRP